MLKQLTKRWAAVVLAALWLGPVAAPAARQGGWPADVQAALALSGPHRAGLERLLQAYRATDSTKYRAACFLVAGSRLHQAFESDGEPAALAAVAHTFASTFGALAAALPNDGLAGPEAQALLRHYADSCRRLVAAMSWSEPPRGAHRLRSDAELIDSAFVAGWVEQVAALRKHSPLARRLSDAQARDYLLPYRSISNYPFIYPAYRYADRYAALIGADRTANLDSIVTRYNLVAGFMRSLMGPYPLKGRIGMDELLFEGSSRCEDVAYYAAGILRAAGVPCIVGCNAANRFYLSNHCHVAAFDRNGRPLTFNPETSLPVYRFPFDQSLNMLYYYFNARPGNPAALRGPKEPVPANLSDPCIEDHTEWSIATRRLTVPYTRGDGRRLAYLASFSSDGGLVAVTWGRIDSARRTVTFEHVVPGNLYFPVVCLQGDTLRGFADPFMMTDDARSPQGYALQPFAPTGAPQVETWIARKFPIKPHMLRLAARTPGMVLVAGNDHRLRGRVDTLWTCSEPLKNDWQDIALPAQKAYRHYRLLASPTDPQIRVSEIEWLADSARGYANTVPPEPLVPGLYRNNELSARWQRLVPAGDADPRRKKSSDGDVTTTPDGANHIDLELPEPQVVSRMRLTVKNAGNAITYGDTYQLYAWARGGWKLLWTRPAIEGEWQAAQLEPGRLYWLHDLTQGTEEMPFTIDGEGRQFFPMQELFYQMHENQ